MHFVLVSIIVLFCFDVLLKVCIKLFKLCFNMAQIKNKLMLVDEISHGKFKNTIVLEKSGNMYNIQLILK